MNSKRLPEPEVADAVAFVRAHLAGDQEAIRCLYATVQPDRLMARGIELLAGICGDVIALDASLALWQQRNAAGSED